MAERNSGRPLDRGSVKRTPSLLAHKLPKDVSGSACLEELSPRPQRLSCSSSNIQCIGGLLYKPPGGSKIAPSVYNGASDPPVVPGQAALSQGNCIPGHLNVGADTLSRQ